MSFRTITIKNKTLMGTVGYGISPERNGLVEHFDKNYLKTAPEFALIQHVDYVIIVMRGLISDNQGGTAELYIRPCQCSLHWQGLFSWKEKRDESNVKRWKCKGI